MEKKGQKRGKPHQILNAKKTLKNKDTAKDNRDRANYKTLERK